MNNVKTTRIEKKYKDKKTGEYKSITIDYAKVADRLKKFWEDHPNGKILTNYRSSETGGVEFKSYIWKDKSEFMELLKNGVDTNLALLSSDSNGTAEHAKDDEKKYEKLETISVGRALALLGYAVSGEVASSEEMEEFMEFKNQQRFEAIENAITLLESAEDMATLRSIFSGLGVLIQEPSIIEAKDKRKAEIGGKINNSVTK